MIITRDPGEGPEAYSQTPVIAWTPFGRKITVSILVEYLRRDHARGIVDEYWLYLNTGPDQDDDLLYAAELAAAHPWIKLVERPADCPHIMPVQRNTGYFYRLAAARPDAVFIRLDDDIVYVHEDAMARLAKAAIERPMITANFGMIWNNAICTHFGQMHGVIPTEWGDVRPYCMDANGWANGVFAVKMHERLLEHIERGAVGELFLYHDPSLQIGQQFSVSCFAALGSMYAELETGPGVLVPDEEESWHTIFRTQQTGMPNMIIGDALVAHFTFGPQRGVVLATDILDRYRALAQKIAAELE